MGRFLFSCVGGLADTKSGIPNIHIKHFAAEGVLTPKGARPSRATGFDPSRGPAVQEQQALTPQGAQPARATAQPLKSNML